MIPGGRLDGFRQKSLAQKAEELRTQKAAYETARSKLESILGLGRSLDNGAFAFPDKEEAITRATRRPAWDEAEKLTTALEQEARTLLQSKLEERSKALQLRLEGLPTMGLEPTDEQRTRVEALNRFVSENKPAEALEEIRALEPDLQKTEESGLVWLGDQVDALLKWAVPSEMEEGVRKALSPCLEFVEKRDLKGAAGCFEENLKSSAPQVAEKLRKEFSDLEAAVPVAKNLGVDVTEAQKLAERSRSSSMISADKIGAKLAAARTQLEEQGRSSLRARLQELKGALTTATNSGADAGEVPHELEALVVEVDRVPLPEGFPLLARAQGLIEPPVLRVVFERLEEVRTYMEEARDLGRNVDQTVEKIRGVRDAIRDKDYTRALKVSSDVLDSARSSVEDMEIAHTELEEFKALIGRLGSGGLDASRFQQYIQEAEAALVKRDFTVARASLREGIRAVGRESSQFLGEQLDRVERTLTALSERHWTYPDEMSAHIEEANLLLSSARVAEAAEVLSQLSIQLKEAVAPSIQARLDELDQTASLIADETTRHQAQATLAQVRTFTGPDTLGFLQKLTEAEREINITMATEVGRVVADLDDALTRLGKMGIPLEDRSREITRVREIFDLGDYPRAAKSGQEILAAMSQLAATRAEEALSEAKLALVEVSKTVPEPATVKDLLEAARTSLQSGNPLEALETAQRATNTAHSIQSTAQSIVDRISQIVNQMTALRKRGATPEELRLLTSKIADVRTAYQSLAFDTAEATIVEIRQLGNQLSLRMDSRTLNETLKAMVDGTGALGLPETAWLERAETCLKDSQAGDPQGPQKQLEELGVEILAKLRPVLDEQLATLDGELRVAREQGLETREADALLSDVRTKMSEKFPTGVGRAIGQVRKQFFQSKAFQETANRALAESREIVNQADLMRLDVKAILPRLAQLEDRHRAMDYGGVLEGAQGVKDQAGTLVRAHLNQVLSNLQGLITRAKREGALTMVAENYLAKARGLVGSTTPMEVLQLVTQAENELEKVELQYSIAQNSLQTISAHVEDADKAGLIVPQAATDLATARKSFESGEYSQLLELVMRTNDLIQQATLQRNRFQETRQRMEPILGALDRLSVDRAEIETALRSADALASKGSYLEADSTVRGAYERARTLFDQSLSARLDSLRPVIDYFAGDESPAVAFTKATQEARQARALEDWSAAVRISEETQKTAVTRIEAILAEEAERLEPVKGRLSDADVASIDEKATVVRGELSRRGFAEATESTRGLHTRINDVLLAYVNGEMEKLEKGARLAEKIGVDGSPIAEGVTEARTLLRQDTPDAAVQRIIATRTKLEHLLAAPLTAKLQEMEKSVQKARDGFNVAIQGLPERIKSAQEQQAQGKLLGATRELIDLGVELTRRKGWQKELADLHYLIDTLIGQAQEAHLPTAHPSELLDRSIQLKADGNYEGALSAANEAVQELRNAVGSKAAEKSA